MIINQEIFACPAFKEQPLFVLPDQFAVFSKPSGIATEAFAENVRKSFTDCSARLVCQNHICSDAHPVHRLDKYTSGCLILGFNHKARRRLGGAFKAHKVSKDYLAVVSGHPDDLCGVITARLKQEKEPYGRTVLNAAGKETITRFEVISYDNTSSILKLSPVTGFTHQLRVVCAEVLKTPIAGDPLYNEAAREFYCETGRQQGMMLHAWNISFPFSVKNGDKSEEKIFTAHAPIPWRTELMKKLMTKGFQAQADKI